MSTFYLSVFKTKTARPILNYVIKTFVMEFLSICTCIVIILKQIKKLIKLYQLYFYFLSSGSLFYAYFSAHFEATCPYMKSRLLTFFKMGKTFKMIHDCTIHNKCLFIPIRIFLRLISKRYFKGHHHISRTLHNDVS